jgi:hypothetical protein
VASEHPLLVEAKSTMFFQEELQAVAAAAAPWRRSAAESTALLWIKLA